MEIKIKGTIWYLLRLIVIFSVLQSSAFAVNNGLSITHAQALLPVSVKQCDGCSASRMKMLAQSGIKNETVVVIDAENGVVRAYDARKRFIDDRILTVVATERSVPSSITRAVSDLVLVRDRFYASLENKFSNLIVPTSIYSDRLQEFISRPDEQTLDANAYEFLLNSSYRRQLYSLFIESDSDYQSITNDLKEVVFQNLSIEFNQGFLGFSMGIEWFDKPFKMTWSDGSFVIVKINSNTLDFEVSTAYDTAGNRIPLPQKNMSPVGFYKIVSLKHYEDFSNYVDTYYDVTFKTDKPVVEPNAMVCGTTVRTINEKRYEYTYSCH